MESGKNKENPMEIRPADNGQEDTRLYEASLEGSVPMLKSLLQKDPLILSKISLTTFDETPLHISALLDHSDFTRELLSHKPRGPKLASELDSMKRSPLHLASAEGHAHIVQALLEVNESMCFCRDEDGRIPLHYAAMRGHVDVINLLIRARPESGLEQLASSGETVLHLCVRYNHLEALKVFVQSLQYYENMEFLNIKEHDSGNTILHISVMLKQIKTIRYLVSIPGVKAGIGTLNKSGRTAFDLVEEYPIRDFKSLKIQSIFMHIGSSVGLAVLEKKQQAGISISGSTGGGNNISMNINDEYKAYNHCGSTKLIKEIAKLTAGKVFGYLNMKDDDKHGEWLEEARGSIMVVATVISTMTFQTAINPPGGVWQECPASFSSSMIDCQPGTSVLGTVPEYIKPGPKHHYMMETSYTNFTASNTISFLGSLSVILLLIGGFPLKNKISMLFLRLAMCITLTFMALTFLLGMQLVAAKDSTFNVGSMYWRSFQTWIALLFIIGFCHTIRFLIWVIKMLRCYCSIK